MSWDEILIDVFWTAATPICGLLTTNVRIAQPNIFLFLWVNYPKLEDRPEYHRLRCPTLAIINCVKSRMRPNEERMHDILSVLNIVLSAHNAGKNYMWLPLVLYKGFMQRAQAIIELPYDYLGWSVIEMMKNSVKIV